MPASSIPNDRRKPFTEGVAVPYQVVFSAEEFARVKAGLSPESMEDKWIIRYEEPHLLFHRSWTGEPVYRVTFGSAPAGVVVTEALWSKHLADRAGADPLYQAEVLDFLVSNLLLGQSKPFPRPRDIKEPVPGLLQHHVAGTGYKENPGKTKAATAVILEMIGGQWRSTEYTQGMPTNPGATRTSTASPGRKRE